MTKQYTAEDFVVGSFWETENGCQVELTMNLAKSHADLNFLCPIFGIITYATGANAIGRWNINGTYPDNPSLNLIRPWREKKRVKGWININADEADPILHENKNSADAFADTNRVACVYIDVEEGEGLEEQSNEQEN